jgi:hypothetical protein
MLDRKLVDKVLGRCAPSFGPFLVDLNFPLNARSNEVGLTTLLIEKFKTHRTKFVRIKSDDNETSSEFLKLNSLAGDR